MKPNWINFKELRSQLSFAHVLDFYGIRDLAKKGGQWVGFCPIPGHNGKRNSPSFSAHPEKGIFQCFGCGAKGNVLDFAVLMEGGNPKRGLDVRKAALKLHKLVVPLAESKSESAHGGKELVVNPPLNFRLKELNSGHPYLLGRGFKREVLDQFGVGFCCRGVFVGRVVIPLHDDAGTLIGYAGRVIDNAQITALNPKYLFPGRRELNGDILEFKKSLFLYNGHRISTPVNDLVVVEGFASVWWLAQHGYPQTVAIMGSSFSSEQLNLMVAKVNPQGRIWVLADGDKAGKRWGEELCHVLASKRLCRMISEDGRQPTDYTESELNTLLGI